MQKSSTEAETRKDGLLEGPHLLVRGQAVPLNEKHPLILGRSPEKADIVLPSSHVSGAHAKIYYEKNTFFVKDEGSLNGTWVDNERISDPTPLSSGDRIRIRPFVILFSHPKPVQSKSGGSFEGDLSVLALADLIQMLHSAGQSGVLYLEPEGVGRPGFELAIAEGHLVAATGGGTSAEAAFFESLKLKSGHFRFASGAQNQIADGQITQATMTLLLEGFQRIDEAVSDTTSAEDSETSFSRTRPFATQKFTR